MDENPIILANATEDVRIIQLQQCKAMEWEEANKNKAVFGNGFKRLYCRADIPTKWVEADPPYFFCGFPLHPPIVLDILGSIVMPTQDGTKYSRHFSHVPLDMDIKIDANIRYVISFDKVYEVPIGLNIKGALR
jgi:hypothetical protein